MLVTHDQRLYEVKRKPVAQTEHYRLYICTDVASGTQYLLQVSTAPEYNGVLERAAFVLRTLAKAADSYQADYANNGGQGRLNYERLFPRIIDAFISAEQGGRRISILAFTDVDGVEQMVPLSGIASRDHSRVGLSSSAWVMGRLLKLIGFVHDQRFSLNGLIGSNVLLDPRQHFAVVFDWSGARAYQSSNAVEDRRRDIADAAKVVFASIGGNAETGDFPYDVGDEGEYVDLLRMFSRGQEADPEEAHRQFYKLVNRLWERKFRPFQILPL